MMRTTSARAYSAIDVRICTAPPHASPAVERVSDDLAAAMRMASLGFALRRRGPRAIDALAAPSGERQYGPRCAERCQVACAESALSMRSSNESRPRAAARAVTRPVSPAAASVTTARQVKNGSTAARARLVPSLVEHVRTLAVVKFFPPGYGEASALRPGFAARYPRFFRGVARHTVAALARSYSAPEHAGGTIAAAWQAAHQASSECVPPSGARATTTEWATPRAGSWGRGGHPLVGDASHAAARDILAASPALSRGRQESGWRKRGQDGSRAGATESRRTHFLPQPAPQGAPATFAREDGAK